MLYQPVHPESNQTHWRSFSPFDSPLFLKTALRVRMSNFKIIFAPSLGSLPNSRQKRVEKEFPKRNNMKFLFA